MENSQKNSFKLPKPREFCEDHLFMSYDHENSIFALFYVEPYVIKVSSKELNKVSP
jgi:hypothetical protein